MRFGSNHNLDSSVTNAYILDQPCTLAHANCDACFTRIIWLTARSAPAAVCLQPQRPDNLGRLVSMVRAPTMKPSGSEAVRNTRWMVAGGILAIAALLYYLHAHHPQTKGEAAAVRMHTPTPAPGSATACCRS